MSTRVHNHPPYRPNCAERRVDDHLRGNCLNDDGSDRICQSRGCTALAPFAVFLDGVRTPACLRHYNHWNAPIRTWTKAPDPR